MSATCPNLHVNNIILNIKISLSTLSILLFLLCIFPNSNVLARGGPSLTVTVDGGKSETVWLDEINENYLVEIETHTPWHDDQALYKGMLVASFLKLIHAEKSKKILMIAINGYIVESELEGVVNAGAMIAWTMNGAAISIHNKGPITIVFPWSNDASLRKDVFTSLSVWHLSEIHLSQ